MTGRSPRATPAIRERIAQLYGEGLTQQQIADQLEVDPATVSRVLERLPTTVEVPRALSADEERTLSAVERWIKLGRSSTATIALSETIGDAAGWVAPNIRLSRSARSLAWWRLCCLHAAAAHRNQLDDLHALLLHIEGEETDDMELARGLALADALIRAVGGRERKFVRKHRLDQDHPEEVEETPQQEAG